jgi:hypothetical protein
MNEIILDNTDIKKINFESVLVEDILLINMVMNCINHHICE